MSAEQHRRRLGTEFRERAPQAPGVYLFHDEGGAILYIGKAVNLRKRLLSHLRPVPPEEEHRRSMLVHAIRSFTCEVVPSELQALVREDELIKLHRPPFNVRQNDYLEYQYLERTSDRFPRFEMVDHAPEFGTRSIFGPFRDRHTTEKLLRLLQRLFGIRACTSPEPTDRCLEFDLGHCPGPCRQAVNESDYASSVELAEAFLRGEAREAERRVRGAMEAAAQRLEFERAQELKEQLHFCRRFCEREQFLAAFREQKLIVVEADRTHVFLRGCTVDPSDRTEPACPRDPALPRGPAGRRDPTVPPPSAEPRTTVTFSEASDRRFLYDRAIVVHGWLRRNRERCRYRFEEISATVAH